MTEYSEGEYLNTSTRNSVYNYGESPEYAEKTSTMMGTQRPTQRKQSNVIVKLMNNTNGRLNTAIVCKRYGILVQAAQ